MCREQEYEGTCVLRIVDYIGNRRLFAGLRGFIDANLKKYEYIDFYCYGFEENYILEAGFTLLDDSDDNIIPNYFQPFERKNIDIWVNSSRDGCLFFKADGIRIDRIEWHSVEKIIRGLACYEYRRENVGG